MENDVNFNKIMEGIILKLTGNSEMDFKILMDEYERYKSHKYSNEILRAISRLMYDILPDDEKEKINQIPNNQNLGIRTMNREINFQIKMRNFDKALVLIESVIKNMEDTGLYINDDKNNYYYFNNLLERLLYMETFKPEKEIRQIPENYSEVYFSYGNILFEVKRYDEAKIVLEKAISYNPVNTVYLFEIGEIYKINKDWEIFLKINRDCLKYAYSNKSIARCYRNFGYYYFEMEKYEIAMALYYLSINFDHEDKIAYSEIMYISEKTGLEIKAPDPQSVINILEDNDIKFGADNLILSIAYSIGREAQKTNQNEIAKFYFNIVYELTKDDEIKKIIDKL